MSSIAPGTPTMLTGWGRTSPSAAQVAGPLEIDVLRGLLAARPAGGMLARGAGRGYGDAAQNAGGLVISPVTAGRIRLDTAAASVWVSASVTFDELLTRVVPAGLLPPVLPGTRWLTVGGAVAADVHGKNQRREGTFADWITDLDLLTADGEIRTLRPGDDAFRATVGGMGLTGIVLGISLRLLRIGGSRLMTTTRRVPDLETLLAELDAADGRYSVAWVDATASGAALGRGIVEIADHLPGAGAPVYRPKWAPTAPRLPFGPINQATARLFNEAWYHSAPRERRQVRDLCRFFFRLDAVRGWNRALGPHGFVQYQFVVPDGGRQVIAEVLRTLQRHRAAPFLGTLKRFGSGFGEAGAGSAGAGLAEPGHLSFPMPGWSLAVDMPDGGPGLRRVLDALDRRVIDAGGRLYLAKDVRLSAEAFEAMYESAAKWRDVRERLDPSGVFRSDLGRRLGLCR